MSSAEQPSKKFESAVDMAKQNAHESSFETAEAALLYVDPSTARVKLEAATAQPSAVSKQLAMAPVLLEAPTAVTGHVALESDSAPHQAADNTSEPAVATLQVSASSSEVAVVESEPAVVESEPAMVVPEPAVAAAEPAVIESEPAVAAAEPAGIGSEPAGAATKSAMSSLEPNQEVREATLVGPGAGVVSVEDSLEMREGQQVVCAGGQQLSTAAAAV